MGSPTSTPNMSGPAAIEETRSPNLPRGLNLGRQIFYLQRRYPGSNSRRRDAFLAYPQYWSPGA